MGGCLVTRRLRHPQISTTFETQPWTLSGLFAFSPVVANAQTAIGSATKVVRQVQGTLANNVRTLKTQDDVLQNEIIKTAADSASEMVFKDDTTLTIGPNAEVVLDTFVFDPDPAKGKIIINQTIGTIRFVSGKLAQQAYEIRTPTATIGIRGTVFTVTVAANGTTTVSVTQGTVAVTNAAGVSQSVGSGFSSTVSPAPPGGTPPPPSPPAPRRPAHLVVSA